MVDGTEEDEGIYLSTFLLPTAFLWPGFTSQGVNSPAFSDGAIQLLSMFMELCPRPYGLLSHPSSKVAGKARAPSWGLAGLWHIDKQRPSFPRAGD